MKKITQYILPKLRLIISRKRNIPHKSVSGRMEGWKKPIYIQPSILPFQQSSTTSRMTQSSTISIGSKLSYILFSLGIALAVVTHAFAGEENMVLIPAGEFIMGSENRGPDEKPAHKVYLDAYYIGKYEVTNEEYYKFWKAIGKNRKPKSSVNEVNRKAKPSVSEANTPESFTDEHGIGTWPERALKFPRHPVVGVSWDDAVAYAEWLGMRLPTEAEWERAARGPNDQLWPWGNSLQPYANIWDGNDGYDNGVAPVGSYPNGKSHYGVMDMAGNVWEWTSDWYSDTYYFHSPKRNPKGADTGSWRVIRGGSWTDDINRCATTFRFYFYPSLKTSFIGFRLARTAETPSSSGTSKPQPSNPAPKK